MKTKDEVIDSLKKALEELDITSSLRLPIIQTIEYLQEEPEYLEEETKYCAFSTSRYTDKERKVLCDGCEELCIYNQKNAAESLGISQEEYEEIIDKCLFDDEPEIVDLGDIPFGARNSELEEAIYHIPEGYHAIIDGDKVIIKKAIKQ